MTLDYDILLPPLPIELAIGASIVQPKLIDIAKIGFPIFYYYETLLDISPSDIYSKIMGEEGVEKWNQFSDDEQLKMTVYDVIEREEWLQEAYVQLFNFFFDKSVDYISLDGTGFFVFLKREIVDIEELDIENDVYGAISRVSFPEVLEIIQYVCGMKDGHEEEEEEETEVKFKNKKARQIYEKMKKARERMKQAKKNDPDFSLINIISAVSNRHPTISPLNVWELTIVQLLDCFSRLQMNSIGEIQSVTVSVWGDEKKQFNPAFWYKNEHK